MNEINSEIPQTKEQKRNKEKRQKNAQRDIFLDYAPYLIIILIVLTIRTFVATPIRVNGVSMDYTLKDGETMILNKLALYIRDINRWDIVVAETPDTYLIKRVIALPGETVEYKNSELLINGEVVEDNYSLTETLDFPLVTLGEDEYFLMGDNRSISQDSRFYQYGPIHRRNIRGITNIVLFPFDRFGIVK